MQAFINPILMQFTNLTTFLLSNKNSKNKYAGIYQCCTKDFSEYTKNPHSSSCLCIESNYRLLSYI